MSEARDPGLAEAERLGLDPDEIVSCWAVMWRQDNRWHRVSFASNGDAHTFALTVPDKMRYVVGTAALRRHVRPPGCI
jgi:hypothetical protein